MASSTSTFQNTMPVSPRRAVCDRNSCTGCTMARSARCFSCAQREPRELSGRLPDGACGAVREPAAAAAAAANDDAAAAAEGGMAWSAGGSPSDAACSAPAGPRPRPLSPAPGACGAAAGEHAAAPAPSALARARVCSARTRSPVASSSAVSCASCIQRASGMTAPCAAKNAATAGPSSVAHCAARLSRPPPSGTDICR
eukprot:363083-Chlamydomonas_euryale.AAC.15